MLECSASNSFVQPSYITNNPPLVVSLLVQLMNALRKAHPALWSKLEHVLDELMFRFRPSLEEELLSAIDALLQRCNTLGDGEGGDSALPASMITTLARVHAKFFSDSGNGGSTPKCKGKGKGKKLVVGGNEGEGIGGGIK